MPLGKLIEKVAVDAGDPDIIVADPGRGNGHRQDCGENTANQQNGYAAEYDPAGTRSRSAKQKG